jgi:hypothetical protein
MTQPGTGPPEIVRLEPLDTRFAGVLADHVPTGALNGADKTHRLTRFGTSPRRTVPFGV